MNVIDRLTEIFSKFPGVGIRQARRFVYFLLTAQPQYVDELVSVLSFLRKKVRQCPLCYRFFEENSCLLCARAHSASVLIVVEKDIDLENIRKGGVYNGLYFVLGGLLAPLVKESFARVNELSARVTRDAENGTLKEIIIALGANPNGDYTTFEIKKILSSVAKQYGIIVTSLGRGMSTGTELEYSDAETIKHAINNRQ